MFHSVYAFSDTFLKYQTITVANIRESKHPFSMNELRKDVRPQKRFKEDILKLIDELDPKDIEVVPMTKGYRAIVDQKTLHLF